MLVEGQDRDGAPSFLFVTQSPILTKAAKPMPYKLLCRKRPTVCIHFHPGHRFHLKKCPWKQASDMLSRMATCDDCDASLDAGLGELWRGGVNLDHGDRTERVRTPFPLQIALILR